MKASELSGDNGIGIPSSKSKSQTGGCVIVAVEFVTTESERYNAMIQTRDENASAAVFFFVSFELTMTDIMAIPSTNFNLRNATLACGW